jgi:hypothetical protein
MANGSTSANFSSPLRELIGGVKRTDSCNEREAVVATDKISCVNGEK